MEYTVIGFWRCNVLFEKDFTAENDESAKEIAMDNFESSEWAEGYRLYKDGKTITSHGKTY